LTVRQKTDFSVLQAAEPVLHEPATHELRLDLVVPFTTPELTRAALDAANRMGTGLDATLRLIRVQVVPFPLDLTQSPVFLEFLQEQLDHFPSELPVKGEIRLARDFEAGLLGALTHSSIVILARRRRPWTTRNERIASALRRAGHKVVVVCEGRRNA
jgi:hypothetical protein